MKRVFYAALAAIFLALCACTNESKTMRLLRGMPDNADVVAVGNMKSILESAGGQVKDGKIVLPRAIDDLIVGNDEEALDEINDMLRNSGADPEVAGFILSSYKEDHPVFTFLLSDSKKFMRYIEDQDFRENDSEDGVTYYSKKTYESTYSSDYDNYSYIAAKGDKAYFIDNVWVGSDFKPEKALKKLIEGAAERSFADNPVSDYIAQADAFGVTLKVPKEVRAQLREFGFKSDEIDQFDGYFSFRGDLNPTTASLEMKWFNEDGSQKTSDDFTSFASIDSKINPAALEFMGKDELAVMAFSLEDMNWGKYFDRLEDMGGLSRSEKNELSAAKDYLKKINGTIAFGIGITGGIESAFDLSTGNKVLEHLSMTMVVETAPGKARSLVNALKDLMDAQRMPYENDKNGFIIKVPGEQGSIYCDAKDNFVAISTRPISARNANPVAKAINFGEHFFVTGVVLNRDSKLMRDLNLNDDVKAEFFMDPKALEATMSVEITGGSEQGVLAKALGIAMDVYNQSNRLEERWRDHTNKYRPSVYDSYDYYDADSVVCDSVAVEVEEIVVAEE